MPKQKKRSIKKAKQSKVEGPKIILLDIETRPLESYTWGIWQQDVPLNMIKKDWGLLSFAAKELGAPVSKVIYQDLSKTKDKTDDKALLKSLWKLLNDCDILITQNGIAFDAKKINARFAILGMSPPSSYKHIDTLKLAKKHFAFTSNKLEYLTDKLCTKYKKLKHKSFPGFSLWEQCLKGNQAAWKEMKKYNIHDILSLEELYTKLIVWGSPVNMGVFGAEGPTKCTCGSTKFIKNGHFYSNVGKFQRYKCSNCGAEFKDNVNMLVRDKTKLVGTKR